MYTDSAVKFTVTDFTVLIRQIEITTRFEKSDDITFPNYV